LAKQRQDDLYLMRSGVRVASFPSSQGYDKIQTYCMATVSGAEKQLDSIPDREYELQTDGTVKVIERPKTLEQRFREGQQAQFELENGGGPMVQDCRSSIFWFRTWHNQPMPTDQQLLENAAKAKADLDEIDSKLDPRLAEVLPK
jgi:hypothetical protein